MPPKILLNALNDVLMTAEESFSEIPPSSQSLKIQLKFFTVPISKFFLKLSSDYVNCSLHKHAELFKPKIQKNTPFFSRNRFPLTNCSGHMECSVGNRIKTCCHESKTFFTYNPKNIMEVTTVSKKSFSSKNTYKVLSTNVPKFHWLKNRINL